MSRSYPEDVRVFLEDVQRIALSNYSGEWRVILAVPVEPQAQIILAFSGSLTTAGVDRLVEYLAILRRCVPSPKGETTPVPAPPAPPG